MSKRTTSTAAFDKGQVQAAIDEAVASEGSIARIGATSYGVHHEDRGVMRAWHLGAANGGGALHICLGADGVAHAVALHMAR
jgi:hypothetical protein